MTRVEELIIEALGLDKKKRESTDEEEVLETQAEINRVLEEFWEEK
jgi:uncharacterized metal-binding protein